MRPRIGITTDVSEQDGRLKADVSMLYAMRVAEAGGVPLLLPAIEASAEDHLALCDGVIFTGGDDPRMEPFGVATHREAKLIHPRRQAYELRLLDLLSVRPGTPALGVCLGMQLMCLHAGGTLDQFLPETLPTHARHKNGIHEIEPTGTGASRVPWLIAGDAWSNHRQAITNPGSLGVIATSSDGVIEGVADSSRRFYVGVQWHPEKTADDRVGAAVFRALVESARRPS